MNIQLIVQFLVLVGETKTQAELTSQMEALLKAYGFEYYGVALQARLDQSPMNLVLAEHWPEKWPAIYAARQYRLVDPAVRMLSIAHRPFRWQEAMILLKNDQNRQRMQRMTQEGARYGLRDGYIFPVHGRNGLLGNVSFAGQPVDLSPAETALFDAAAKKLLWRFLELRGLADELEAIEKMDSQLTRREADVLVLLAEGLTSNEIAKSLNISSHTVDWYINGLQEKLKAKNRQHVVASAFRLGLVS